MSRSQRTMFSEHSYSFQLLLELLWLQQKQKELLCLWLTAAAAANYRSLWCMKDTSASAHTAACVFGTGCVFHVSHGSHIDIHVQHWYTFISVKPCSSPEWMLVFARAHSDTMLHSCQQLMHSVAFSRSHTRHVYLSSHVKQMWRLSVSTNESCFRCLLLTWKLMRDRCSGDREEKDMWNHTSLFASFEHTLTWIGQIHEMRSPWVDRGSGRPDSGYTEGKRSAVLLLVTRACLSECMCVCFDQKPAIFKDHLPFNQMLLVSSLFFLCDHSPVQVSSWAVIEWLLQTLQFPILCEFLSSRWKHDQHTHICWSSPFLLTCSENLFALHVHICDMVINHRWKERGETSNQALPLACSSFCYTGVVSCVCDDKSLPHHGIRQRQALHRIGRRQRECSLQNLGNKLIHPGENPLLTNNLNNTSTQTGPSTLAKIVFILLVRCTHIHVMLLLIYVTLYESREWRQMLHLWWGKKTKEERHFSTSDDRNALMLHVLPN